MEKGEGYKVEKGREKSRENIVTDMEGENFKKEGMVNGEKYC